MSPLWRYTLYALIAADAWALLVSRNPFWSSLALAVMFLAGYGVRACSESIRDADPADYYDDCDCPAHTQIWGQR